MLFRSNNAEYLAHKWGKELISLKGKKFNKFADHYLGFIVINFDNEEAARIVLTWLTTYQLTLKPNLLKKSPTIAKNFAIKIGKHLQIILLIIKLNTLLLNQK